jgi:hypothetical protein
LKAIKDYEEFFKEMKLRGYMPKVAQLDQVKLDFPDVDEDPNIKDAVEDLKRKGQLISSKRIHNPEVISISEPGNKRFKSY